MSTTALLSVVTGSESSCAATRGLWCSSLHHRPHLSKGRPMTLKLCPCGAVTDARGKSCDKCGGGKRRATQGTTKAGYDGAWKNLSVRYREEHPLCEQCVKSGIATPADEVHHIVPITEAPWLRLEWNNLMALCVPCHRSMDQARRQG
jgi:5-methylcytosine-specific restriction protein A